MKTSPLFLTALATLAGAASLSAQSVLAIGNGNDAAYESFVTGTLGGSWTFVVNGTGSGQLGGDLDSSFNGGSQTRRDYINAFDRVVILRGSNSGSYTNTDWAGITVPILVHNVFVARQSRLGLYNNDGGVFDQATVAPDSVVLAPSSPLLAGVAVTLGQADLFTSVNTGGFDTTYDVGGGTRITTIAGSSPTLVNLAVWPAGATTFNGSQVLAAERVFLGISGTFGDLSADGRQVVRNFLIPEPSTYAALAGALALAATVLLRRRRS